MNKLLLGIIIITSLLVSCKSSIDSVPNEMATVKVMPFTWENANIYFLMTDRFYNGDKSNDFVHNPKTPPAPYRGFMGGDIAGVTHMIRDGYFNQLGVNAIWTTPVLENIEGSVDEGTGTSYGFHGYWTRDWTAFDSRVTTEQQFADFVKTAHQRGIRVIMDAIVNHTGPVTEIDGKWPDDWVRTGPQCKYTDYETTVTCTLVKNLPDILTDSDQEVKLPSFLIEKWKSENRYDKEVAELDAFFERTGYPRTPKYYIIKWLCDYIRKYGIDGFRVDTAKHTEAEVWKILKKEAEYAFEMWKKENPEQVIDDKEFYMVGEVYNYFPTQGRAYNYGDKKVDFFNYGYDALINFDFKSDANMEYDALFNKYDAIVHDTMDGYMILNYISSHDDGGPFDLKRERTMESATKLMLTPGQVQIYYGDESSRSLTVEAQGDATLRSFMNWEDQSKDSISLLLHHWQKLGQFRNNHPCIGAGRHVKIADEPYTFMRSWSDDELIDQVVICLTSPGAKKVKHANIFSDGEVVRDYYSGEEYIVTGDHIEVDSESGYILLEKIK